MQGPICDDLNSIEHEYLVVGWSSRLRVLPETNRNEKRDMVSMVIIISHALACQGWRGKRESEVGY